MSLPPPAVLLGLPKFGSWRQGQEQVFQQMMAWYAGTGTLASGLSRGKDVCHPVATAIPVLPNSQMPLPFDTVASVGGSGNVSPLSSAVSPPDSSSPPIERFLGLAAATGIGKSVLAVLLARMSGARTCILTATKGLQDQLMSDFAPLGMVQVRGQNNFSCTLLPNLRADEGPCHEGMSCTFSASGCPYREQLARAVASPLVLTNYAYYLAQTRFSSGLGQFGLLICDESHLAFAALESHLSISLSKLEVESLGVSLPPATLVTNPKATAEQSASLWYFWRGWSKTAVPAVSERVKELELDIKSLRSAGQPVPSAVSRSFRAARSTAVRLDSLAQARGDWVIQRTSHGFQFTPIWVKGYGNALFQSIPKVVLMSAILTNKTCDSLGVPQSPERRWIEAPSYFPAKNTPIWHVPTTRVNYHTDNFGTAIWLARIDQILDRRLDRKGIIFTVSYKRRDLLLQRSRHASIMVSHSASDVTEMVRRFKAMAPPAVLVSPAVTSGWDFPGDCKFIVVGKIPYPDTSDPVMVARQAADKEWSSFMAMETIVQESGRGTRSATDTCEVLVIDDSWRWYWPLYKKFAPSWFAARVRGSLQSVPDPLV